MIKFRRYPGCPDGTGPHYAWYYLRIGKFHAEFNRSDRNFHGPNREMRIKGWQIINLKNANGGHGYGLSYRVIKYWPNGAWWYLDVNWNRRRVK